MKIRVDWSVRAIEQGPVLDTVLSARHVHTKTRTIISLAHTKFTARLPRITHHTVLLGYVVPGFMT